MIILIELMDKNAFLFIIENLLKIILRIIMLKINCMF